MDSRIRSVVVLGGGTAGWMAAAYLAKSLSPSVRVTVLEAPTIARIGVGEATVPNLQRVLFDHLGIAESEWMRECNASFKMAVRFINWRTDGPSSPAPRGYRGRPDVFHHPFGLLPAAGGLPLSHYWADDVLAGRTDEPYDYRCFVEPPLMDANLAPRFLDGTKATNYAWHMDAHLVADFLRRVATERFGVVHVEDEMVEARQDERGYLTSLRTRNGREITGDLFVDCSGFRGLLINQVMGEPFLDMNDHLLCDSAVAYQIPHDDAAEGIEPYTSAIAMSSGWTWKIPLLGRFGTGYVFSSKFQSRDDATREFARMWGLDPGESFNQISFRVGRNRRAWVKNCVSLGLASCFLEPLESTGLYFTYAAIYQLAKHFPDRTFSPVLVDRFNREIADMFDDTRDFLQAHFCLAPRQDSEFWRANKSLTLPDSIQEKLAMYHAGLPINPPVGDETHYYGNFEYEFRNFWTNGSYYCIFTGLGLLPKHPSPLIAHGSPDAAALLFDGVRARQAELLATLPSTYEYLRALHEKAGVN